jgi:hypothetical protein
MTLPYHRYMRRKLLAGGICVFCLACAVSCSVWWARPALFTLQHGREMEQALQSYWGVRHSPETSEDPARLSDVMTGDLLTATVRLYSGSDNPFQTIPSCQVTVNSVKEYLSGCSRVSAQVVCGEGWGMYSGNTGQYIFLREESRWKVVNFWQDVDTHNTFWPSSTPPTCKDFLRK